MTDQILTTLIIAFFASLPPTVAAVAALVAARRGVAKTEEISVKADQIHKVANGNLSAVKAELHEAQRDNQELRAELSLAPREHRASSALGAHAASELLAARFSALELEFRTLQERLSADTGE